MHSVIYYIVSLLCVNEESLNQLYVVQGSYPQRGSYLDLFGPNHKNQGNTVAPRYSG